MVPQQKQQLRYPLKVISVHKESNILLRLPSPRLFFPSRKEIQFLGVVLHLNMVLVGCHAV